MKTRTSKLTMLVSIAAVAGMFVVPMVVKARSVEKYAQGTELSAVQDDSSMVDYGTKKKPPKKKK